MKHKILMTLVLLLTAATGAWAEGKQIGVGVEYQVGDVILNNGNDVWINVKPNSESEEGIKINTDLLEITEFRVSNDVGIIKFYADQDVHLYDLQTGEYIYHEGREVFTDGIKCIGSCSGTITKVTVTSGDGTKATPYVFTATAEGALTVEWNASTKTGTFSMPGSDVVLTPIYSAATVHHYDETETTYASLKEAFANLKDGDEIKLDWDVTLTEKLQTPSEGAGVFFTLDFNGYTISGDYGIYLANAGDKLTFTDSSEDQMGGYKSAVLGGVTGYRVVFEAGRYSNFGGYSATAINSYCADANFAWSLTDGKEFVDLEGGAAENDGFFVRVGYKAFELTIGAGRFATFYMDQNVKLDEETPAGVGFYTITSTDEARTKATVTPLTGVVEKETPMLVYNGTDAQQTVKIKVTPAEADAENQGISPLENFMGTAVAKPFTEDDMAAADYYALSGGKAFVPVYDAGTIGKNQCWLQFPKQQTPGARSITLVFEETTGVNEVIEVNEVGDDSWYDLNGRRIQRPTKKGVYISNGKKVVK